MTYSALWFSQMQFFGSLSFMAVFFALSLALSWLLFYFRLRALGEQHLLWLPVYRFWVRIFALSFLLSFASSMPVLLQLGSLWPQLLPKTQAVSSPLLAATILSALVFKAAFLGLMLYGQRQIAEQLHAAIIFFVALGNSLVAFFLLVFVSWMHTPRGTEWVEGQYVVQSWTALFSNPSVMWYVALFFSASFVLVALLMMAVLALQSIRRPLGEAERRVFALAVYVGSVAWLLLLVAFLGNGHMVENHQPAKAAAAMGVGLVAGMSPPLALVYWSLRTAMFSGLLVLLVLLQGWRVGLWRHADPSALSLLSRRLFVLAGFIGPVLLVNGMAYQLFGSLPFVVSQTITLNEVYASTTVLVSAFSFFSYSIIYTVFVFGFIALVRQVTRYGVVSVARRRGKA